MRILRLIASMNPALGGPSQGIRHSVKQQMTAGIYNEVVCLDDPKETYLGNDPFPVHAIGPGKGSWYYASSLMPWLTNNLQRFDVLIVHGLWQYCSYAGWKAVRQLRQQSNTGIRYFVMPHGMLDPYFQQASSRRVKAIRNWVYWKLIEHRVIRDAEGILFTTQTELELARKPFIPYQPKREINVGYGIETPPTYTESMQMAFKQACPQATGKPYLLFLSRVNHKKGVDMLVRAYSSLLNNESLDTANIPNLVIAGPGLDESFGRQVQQLVTSDQDLIGRIYFTGMLLGHAKWGALYGCEAFVLPSHQENFGIAVVEAMACGKAVLISDQVNIWREVKLNFGGLTEPDNLNGTTRLLTEWMNMSNEQKQNMGCNAKIVHKQLFSIENLTLRFIEAIKTTKDEPKIS